MKFGFGAKRIRVLMSLSHYNGHAFSCICLVLSVWLSICPALLVAGNIPSESAPWREPFSLSSIALGGVVCGVCELQTKPHGHGDVHALLHSTGLAKKWAAQGFKWVAFFQASGTHWMDGYV